jgi:hypothetical protein
MEGLPSHKANPDWMALRATRAASSGLPDSLWLSGFRVPGSDKAGWLSNGLTGQRYRLTTIWTSPGIELFCRDSPHAPSTLGGSE